eukprot:snap_masked-scaffold_43-processed-gene-0.21-mRNA-1 protein AED:1.00 eAED:1.00 QI:0/-1/0/0/-1/1/1/0/83
MEFKDKKDIPKCTDTALKAEEVEVEKRLKLKKNQGRARKAFYSGVELKGNLNSERNKSKLKALKFLKEIPESVLEDFDKLNIV